IQYSAGGFKDFTRIASSPAEMWRDICLLNRDAILETIKKFQTTLARLERLIENRDGEGMYQEFERAKTVRDSLKVEKR
ncbi:prephenate dehydrogenase/arogenate dehydrogenase family protein, partial [Candidatus Gottesmanbacteria bacterium]|nr:prephenate dehydrogenase/arogenate dehydrogenase family protein [Candidatus Gottesmanbacteria bacterium]